MRLKDVQSGKVYATVSWRSPRDWPNDVSQWGGVEWERFAEAAIPFRVDEVGVPVATYSRSGVRGVYLDRETLEPREHGGAMLAVSLLGEWDALRVGVHEFFDARAEESARRQEEREREGARKQEAAAREWMQRQFEDARADIDDVVSVLSLPPVADLEGKVRELVELRNPEGNPYLNGKYTAH